MKRKTLLLIALCLLCLVGCGKPAEQEQDPAAWTERPAIWWQGRYYYWNCVLPELPHDEGEWMEQGALNGISRRIEEQPQDLWLYARPLQPETDEEDTTTGDILQIPNDTAGVVWTGEAYPDVLYVRFTAGDLSDRWTRFAIKELEEQALICWDGKLYTAPRPYGETYYAELLDALPEGCVEVGRIDLRAIDRVPTENGSANGSWRGMGDHPGYETYYSGVIWQSSDHPEEIYLRQYRSSKSGTREVYIAAHLLTAAEAGELTVPAELLPLAE